MWEVGDVDGWLEWLTAVAAVGCGLNAGVFFAFSTFVMQGLRRAEPDQGIAAMQGINVTAPASLFGAALIGTGLLCVALVVVAAFGWGEAEAAPLLVGAALYLLGSIAMTFAFHVPRNDALDRLDPRGPGAADHWRRYLIEWVAGNHVRTLASIGATIALVLALR